MHAILASVGTDGDVFPYVALGSALRQKGHRATLAASSQYKKLAEERGLGFCPIVSEQQNHALLANPDFWHPIKGGQVAAQWGIGFLPKQYSMLASLASEDNSVFISNPGVMAARIVSETHGCPIVTLILQPWMIPSVQSPPVMPAGLTLPKWAPAPLGHLYFRLIHLAVDALTRRPINELRHRLGLEAIEHIGDWWFSPQLILGMFPEWFGQRQEDWPPQFRSAGFVITDGPSTPLAEQILAFCKGGPPPIVFTFGSGMMHAAKAYRAAADACSLLGARGILLTRFSQQVPANLPATIRHFCFAPFGELFKHCRAVVHHGGIGTAAQAMSAGVPQLVLPYSYDQFDNAVRLKGLGVGEWLKPAHRTSHKIAEALSRLDHPAIAMRCRSIADRMKDQTGLCRAVTWIENLVMSQRRY